MRDAARRTEKETVCIVLTDYHQWILARISPCAVVHDHTPSSLSVKNVTGFGNYTVN